MTVYISPENRDTRYNLWYVTYPCTAPYIQTRSIEEIKEYGTRISQNKAYDDAAAWERHRCALTVVQMIQHWMNGVNLNIIDLDKYARKIYDDLEAHLKAWGEHMDRAFNSRKVPEADLIAMDEFCALMYKHAKWIEVKHYYSGLLQPKKAIPSRATLGQFWAEQDKIKERQREQGVIDDKLLVQTYNFGGIEYVKDTNRMLEEIRKAGAQAFAGKLPLDIYPARESFVNRMKESGHFRNFTRS